MIVFNNEAKCNFISIEIQSYNNAQLCQSKATAWTPCSKTCGLGISTRMSNSNFDCKIERQTRLCNLRPCSDLQNVIIPQVCRFFNSFYQLKF